MDDRNTGVAATRQDVQAAVEFQPIATRSMFWRPNYLDYVEKSGWMEHIPFAFWLIEAHRPRVLVELGTHAGTSYFAFCQAVERLGLDTRCFAVDTWKGDAHSGLYSESVFERVRAYNDAQYSGFSRLVRSTFDQALSHFSDHTVDLLHIDGLHTLEAVTHDFDSWADKLSDRAVVVMHDTNVRERGFEVFALFEKLKTRFPTFEFVHGHGLGVVAAGPDQSESMRQLFGASGNPVAEREIRDVFARLGRACADTYSAGRAEQREKELAAQVEQHKQQLADALQKVEKLSSEHSGRSRDLADARSRLQGQVEQHALERGQLAERVSLLKETRDELKASAQRMQANADGARAELDARTRDIELLKRQASEVATRIQQSDAAMQARDAQLARIAQEHERTVAGLQAQLAEAAGKLRNVQNQHAEALSLQLGQVAELKQALRAREAHLATTQAQQGDAKQQLVAREQVLQGEIAGLQQRLQAGEQQLSAREQALQGEIAGLQQRLQAGEQQLSAREQALRGEIAGLQQRLQAWEQQLGGREQSHQREVTELRKQLQSGAQQQVESDALLRQSLQARDEMEAALKQRFAETAELTKMIISLQEQLQAKATSSASLGHEHQEETARLRRQLKASEAQLAEQAARLCKVDQAREEAEVSLNLRFAETAKLAKMVIALEEERDTEVEAVTSQLDAMQENSRMEIARLEQALEEREQMLQTVTGSRSWRLTAPFRRKRPAVALPTQIPASAAPSDAIDVNELQLMRQSGLFDEAWYLARYPDVAACEVDPVMHYVEFGAAELRDPGPGFSTAGYLRLNPDVAASGLNPLSHFVEHGRGEGRIAPPAS